MSDILDRIDELVDEQLAGGEPENGYDYSDPDYPRCPHCNRHWHGLPVTERIAGMYSWGRYDEDYRVDADDSTVLCPGSDFIGPVRTAVGGPRGGRIPWPSPRRDISMDITVNIDMTAWNRAMDRMREAFESMTREFDRLAIQGFRSFGFMEGGRQATWIQYAAPTNPQPVTCELPDVKIEFGPQNWHLDFQYPRQPRLQFPSAYPYRLVNSLSLAVYDRWRDFTAPNFPIPSSPGYDFSGFDEEIVRGPKRRIDGRRA